MWPAELHRLVAATWFNNVSVTQSFSFMHLAAAFTSSHVLAFNGKKIVNIQHVVLCFCLVLNSRDRWNEARALQRMLVDTPPCQNLNQAVQIEEGEGGVTATPEHPGGTECTVKNKEWKKENGTIRRAAHAAERSTNQTPHTQTKKRKYFQKHNTFFFFIFYIQLNSDIIVNKDQYIFYNHFKVPLIFFWVFTFVQAKHTLQSARLIQYWLVLHLHGLYSPLHKKPTKKTWNY